HVVELRVQPGLRARAGHGPARRGRDPARARGRAIPLRPRGRRGVPPHLCRPGRARRRLRPRPAAVPPSGVAQQRRSRLPAASRPGTGPPGGGGIRLAPAAVRFHSGLAGDEGSRLTYAVPVARVADSGLAPALSRSRVWRNSGGLDFLPLRGLQLRVDAASLRDLRDYGDSTTIARLMRQERRTLLGQDVGVETQRTITTAVTATPQVGAWLRPRAAVVTSF